jgi:hypothetical protein
MRELRLIAALREGALPNELLLQLDRVFRGVQGNATRPSVLTTLDGGYEDDQA